MGPEASARLYVFFWRVDVWAFESIYDSNLLTFTVTVFEGHEKGFYGVGTFEMYLHPQVVACPLEPFPQTMDVRFF